MTAEDWIRALPAELASHTGLLSRLLAALQADERVRALELQCSVARGAGDELSDLDVGIWIADGRFDERIRQLPALLQGLGEIVDAIATTLDSNPYFFVQFADGVQLDAVARRASEARGRVPDAVVLLDRDDLFGRPYEPTVMRADDETRRAWAFFAWVALANLDKYLRRGSLWEALQQLEEARTNLLRLHAASLGIPYPSFGLTSVLDAPADLPDGLEETIARLDAGDIRRAAGACADLLDRHEPPPLAGWVRRRLDAGAGQR